MLYRLKFGEAFATQKYQMCVIGESPAKFCRPSLHALSVEVFLQPKNTEYALSLKVRPKSTKSALSLKVRGSFVAHNS